MGHRCARVIVRVLVKVSFICLGVMIVGIAVLGSGLAALVLT
jgi:hypothetical protein